MVRVTPAAIAAAFGVPEETIARLSDDCITVLARVVHRRGWLVPATEEST